MSFMDAGGLLSGTQEAMEGVYLSNQPAHGWGAVAYECASYLPGTHQPMRGGCRWGMSQSTAGVIYTYDYWETVQIARGICKQLANPLIVPLSLGGCIRSLLEWVCPVQAPVRQAERFLIGEREGWVDRFGTARRDYYETVPYQYHDCEPGKYANLTQYDCSGYYFQLISRLPSLKLTVGANNLHFDPWKPDEREKWKELLAAVCGHKTIRNAIYGCGLGTDRPIPARNREGDTQERISKHSQYYRDNKPFLIVSERYPVGHKRAGQWHKVKTNKPNPEYGQVVCKPVPLGEGGYRPAMLLIARTGYELCHAESQACNSVYSTVDSVTCRQGYTPKIWEEFGIKFGIAHTKSGKPAQGKSEICARGVWRVGPRSTVWYKKGNRDYIDAPRPLNPPRHLYTNDWLCY